MADRLEELKASHVTQAESLKGVYGELEVLFSFSLLFFCSPIGKFK
jgi:hypothetical protein